jgi:hypothetical protein
MTMAFTLLGLKYTYADKTWRLYVAVICMGVLTVGDVEDLTVKDTVLWAAGMVTVQVDVGLAGSPP